MKIGLISLALACTIFGSQATWANPTADSLVNAAIERTRHRVTYDGAYQPLTYPGGDVDPKKGVCTDVVIRSYRAIGIDFQVLIHEDMQSNFQSYPNNWGLTRPDSNIDHRRVSNIRRFLERQGASLPITKISTDYEPGDLVTWNLFGIGNVPHIGIVTDQLSRKKIPLIVHNIGAGPKLENMLFDYKITGHYRFLLESD